MRPCAVCSRGLTQESSSSRCPADGGAWALIGLAGAGIGAHRWHGATPGIRSGFAQGCLGAHCCHCPLVVPAAHQAITNPHCFFLHDIGFCVLLK